MLLKPLGILQRVTKSQRVHISHKKNRNKKLNSKRFFAKKNAFSIFVVIKITVVLNECDCVANPSLLDFCNSIPNSG